MGYRSICGRVFANLYVFAASAKIFLPRAFELFFACGPPLRPIFSLLECCFAILLQMAWHSSSAFVLGSAWMALE